MNILAYYKNRNIRTKLIIGFSIVAGLAILLGVVGVVSLTKTAANNAKIYENSAVPIEYLSGIQNAYQQSRVSVRDMIRANSKDEMQPSVDIITQQREDAGEMTEKVRDFVENDEDLQAAFDQFIEARTLYGEQLDEIIELGLANSDFVSLSMLAEEKLSGTGKVVPAGSFTQASTKYRESFDQLQNAFLASGKNVVDQSAASATTSIIFMSALVVMVGVAGVTIGLLVSASISNPVKKSLNMIREMSKGHLSMRMHIDSQDEVGQMAKAMDSFADDLQTKVIGTMQKIAAGDMTAVLEQYDNEDEVTPALKTTISTVRSLVAETNGLIGAAVEGHLDSRANVDAFDGSWKELLSGFNEVLETVVKPIREASSVLEGMAKGDLSVRMIGEYKGDYAVIKQSMNATLTALSGYVSEISNVLTDMAHSNIDVSIKGEYLGDFTEIKNALNLIADNFNQILRDMNTASDQVTAGSHQVADGSQALSQGATEQASSVEELTTSINEIADQTRQNAMSANEANELASTALLAAEQGNSRMKDMQKAMEEINDSSTSIAKIIKVIDEIAFQTNILALNAAVEAAHAGQHGKGFAVVAEEVRNLAARSAAAAKETSGMIEGSIRKVEVGTKIADDTAKALELIVKDVERATELVGSIAIASNEQATGIAQINQGVEQVSKVVQANSATAEQGAQASEELSGQAELLKKMIDQFTLRADPDTKRRDMLPHVEPEVEMTSSPASDADEAMPQAETGSKKGGKSVSSAKSATKESAGKPKILLSDHEFGKY